MSWVWHNKRQPVIEPQWDEPVLPLQQAHQEYLVAWEQRCRGYEVLPFPVALEPPFTALAADPSAGLKALDGSLALPDAGAPQRAHVAVRLPLAQKVTPALAEGLLTALLRPGAVASFEIIANSAEIAYQWTHEDSEAEHLLAALHMHCPLAAVELGDDWLQTVLQPMAEESVGYQVIDFGLYQPIYLPLKHFTHFTTDPQSGLIAALAQLQDGEVAGVQVLYSGTAQPWAESITELVARFDQPGARYESSLHRKARSKLASPLTACIIRVFAVSANKNSTAGDSRAFALCQRLGGALSALAETGGNQLVALDNTGYEDEAHFIDLLNRTSHRLGLLLSTAELAGLVHPPVERLEHPKLVRVDPRERPLPEHLKDEKGAIIGTHIYRNKEQAVAWPDDYHTRHAYILGATRMGKSTLMLNLIRQDMADGRGLCVIDPHGDLAKDVLHLVPPSRASDALYLDFSDRDYPVAMGLLEAGDEWEKRLLVSDILAILRRLFAASWGDRLEHILRQVLITLLHSQEQQTGPQNSRQRKSTPTLRDIRPLLTDKAYREQLLQGITDPDLLTFWQDEFHGYSPATLSPIYNKLGLLLSSPLVRNIVAQPQSKLPIARLMAEQKILIVNLAQSLIGEDNAHFLGALLVSKIQIAAMQSLRRVRGSRAPFTLYVDEFQNFVVSSFQKILSEAGKVELSLVMANQFLEQLNAPLQTAILSNVGTLISFRVSSDSARHLEREFGGVYPAAMLGDLGRGEAIVRLGQGRDSFRIDTLPPPSNQLLAGKPLATQADWIIAQTRATCCRPRNEVEAGIAPDLNNADQERADEEPGNPDGMAPDTRVLPSRTSSPTRSSGRRSAGKAAGQVSARKDATRKDATRKDATRKDATRKDAAPQAGAPGQRASSPSTTDDHTRRVPGATTPAGSGTSHSEDLHSEALHSEALHSDLNHQNAADAAATPKGGTSKTADQAPENSAQPEIWQEQSLSEPQHFGVIEDATSTVNDRDALQG